MSDLTTMYMGLRLRNPVIVSSSSLTMNVEGITRLADAGAGAVVLKSLFEEQIEATESDLHTSLAGNSHPEAMDYLAAEIGKEYGPGYYIDLIRTLKKSVNIPVIASINCVSPRWWVSFAKKVEAAGADGLELNIGFLPSEPEKSSLQVEDQYYEILRSVKSVTSLPVAVKIGPFFTSLGNFAYNLHRNGADALVLFNRFYQVDMDINSLDLKMGSQYSSPNEIFWSLRWIAMLTGRVPCSLAANTGIHDAEGAIKQLLAGASAVQIASTLYLNSIKRLTTMIEDLTEWMDKHNFQRISDFRGALSQKATDQPEFFERIQYIKAIVGIE